MKSLIASILVLGLVGLVVGVVVQGADTAPVSATVTPELISVTVDVASVAYGIVPLSTVNAAPSPTDSVITPTNAGNVTVKLDIRGANSTTWTLSSTAVGANQFMHKFGIWTGTLGALTALDSVAYAVLDASVAPLAAGDSFKLRLSTPNSTTVYAEESTTVTILATKI